MKSVLLAIAIGLLAGLFATLEYGLSPMVTLAATYITGFSTYFICVVVADLIGIVAGDPDQ